MTVQKREEGFLKGPLVVRSFVLGSELVLATEQKIRDLIDVSILLKENL
jgi:hypothetical protein